MKKIPDTLDVRISALHSDGFGLAETEFGKLAIAGTLAGEQVSVQPLRRKRKFRMCKLVSIEKVSPHRVTPPCNHSSICGGCSLQHFHSTEQIRHKQDHVLSLFGELVPETLLAPLQGSTTGYRKKARLGVKFVQKQDRVLVGFREKLGGLIADIDSCKVLADPFSEMIKPFELLVEKLSVKDAIPQIEIAAGDTSSAAVFRHLQELTHTDLSHFRDFSASTGIDVYLQPGGPSSLIKLGEGESRLFYRMPDQNLEFAFHPLDFIQVNQDINRKLVTLVVNLLEIGHEDSVLDLFCGIGNFTLPLAQKAAFVKGFELSGDAVERAMENSSRNRIENVSFVEVDLFQNAERLLEDFEGARKALLDPPRSGALAVVEALVKSKVERVVYVSCNPVSLARDAGILCQKGSFRMISAGVVDMFPHTAHVESVACFVR